jgi:ferredoxin-thioredoxin reductase catalytic subunit/glutaredoxin
MPGRGKLAGKGRVKMSVKVYTLSTCPYCDRTMEFLRSNGIEFEAVVVDRLAGKEQEGAIGEAYRLSGQRSFPVTDVNGTGVIGYDIPRFKRLLGLEERGESAAPVSVKAVVDDKEVEKLRAEAEKTGYILNPDNELANRLASGLLKNEERHGYRSCPCRLATGDYNRDCDIICPCAYRDWDLDTYGRCYCGLYVTGEFIKRGAKITPIPDSRETLPIAGRKREEKVEVCETLAEPTSPDISEMVKVFSYTLRANERDELREEFERISASLGLERVVWHGESAEGIREFAEGGRVAFRFLQGMEGYVYILRVSPGREGRISSDALKICMESLHKRPNELYHLDILIGKGNQDLLAKDIKGQRLRDGSVVLSGYESKEGGRKYIVTPSAGGSADRLIDDIVRMETSYNLLISQRQKYLLLADQLSRVEERVATKMGVINLNISKADGETLKGWLHCLSINFGEISGITEELKRHAADTEGRRNVLQSILERWEGGPLEGVQSVSEPLWFYTKAIGDDYGRLTQRVDGIRREMGDVITILRTRVDLIQQEQSLDIQKSMHETAKTQLRMQRAVESLEVFIVTYYMTALAKITFEALEAQGRHLPDKPIILAGYLIPVFFVFSIFLSGKIGHLFESVRDRFRGNSHE